MSLDLKGVILFPLALDLGSVLPPPENILSLFTSLPLAQEMLTNSANRDAPSLKRLGVFSH